MPHPVLGQGVPCPSERKQPRQDMIRRMATLMGGSVAGQLVSVLAAFALTRLYSPEAFAHLEMFALVTGIGAVLGTGKFEQALMLPKAGRCSAQLAVGRTALGRVCCGAHGDHSMADRSLGLQRMGLGTVVYGGLVFASIRSLCSPYTPLRILAPPPSQRWSSGSGQWRSAVCCRIGEVGGFCDVALVGFGMGVRAGVDHPLGDHAKGSQRGLPVCGLEAL